MVFSSQFIHDNGVGLVLSMVSGIQQEKQVYNYKANVVGVVNNEWMNYLHV